MLSQLIPALKALWAELAPVRPFLGVSKLVPADGTLEAAHKWAEVALQQLPAPVRAQRGCTRAGRKTCRTSAGAEETLNLVPIGLSWNSEFTSANQSLHKQNMCIGQALDLQLNLFTKGHLKQN